MKINLKYKIFLTTIFCCIITYAQNYQITYSQKINFDNKSFEDINATYYDLYINDKESVYLENKELKDNTHEKNRGEINLTKDRTSDQKLFKYRNLKDFYFNTFIGNEHHYIVKDVFELNWKIDKETKNILNFKTQKATTNFRGRNYTAWFAIEIGYPHGPWKFNGLPGLILEIYDDKNFFRIDAIKIENVNFNISNFLKDYDLENTISIEEYNLKGKEYSQKMLEKVKLINPKFKMDEKCESCNKSVEIF